MKDIDSVIWGIMQRVAKYIVWLSIAIAAIQIGQRVGFELSGVHNTDAPIFAAVGRGILHGLTPYQDLFETKPPGIFFLYAASLRLFDTDLLVRLLQVLVLLSLPFIIAFSSSKQRMVSFLFGSVLSLYLAYESGEMQVETFGVFFSALYIFSFLRMSDARLQCALGSLCIAGAIGMKEPFILSILASVLIFAPKQIHKLFLLPFIIATAIGAMFMAVTGYLLPYLKIYLPYMVGFNSHRAGSPVIRGFNLFKIVSNLWGFSPFLALLIGGLLIVCIYRFYREKNWVHLAAILLATYFVSFAVGTGGDYMSHHFMFAVPAYITLFILSLNFIDVRYAIPVFFLSVVFHAQTSYAARLKQIRTEDAKAIQAAQILDDVLDRCKINRYRIVGDIPVPIYGYTRHSPLGNSFFQYSLYVYETGFKDSFVESVMNAKLIIMGRKSRYLPPPLLQYIKDNFTTSQPSCAENASMQDMVLLFRR